jgi:ribonucleoside-diphosphate reductase beta chain
MKGMGQIVSWSVRDESLHCENIIKLFRTFIEENPDIWDDELKSEIYEIARQTVALEDRFIDLAFEQGGVQGMEPAEVKQYIRYITDRRLIELGMKSNFHVRDNPLPWVDHLISGVEHTNFFENRATAYSKASTIGNWSDAYEDFFADTKGVLVA